MTKEEREYCSLGRVIFEMVSKAFEITLGDAFFSKRKLTFKGGKSCFVVLLRDEQQLAIVEKAIEQHYQVTDVQVVDKPV